jgi:hypothetical protein
MQKPAQYQLARPTKLKFTNARIVAEFIITAHSSSAVRCSNPLALSKACIADLFQNWSNYSLDVIISHECAHSYLENEYLSSDNEYVIVKNEIKKMS